MAQKLAMRLPDERVKIPHHFETLYERSHIARVRAWLVAVRKDGEYRAK